MPLEMKYFVLKPAGTSEFAAASRHAMWAFSEAIRGTDQELANELHAWVKREALKAVAETPKEREP